MRGLNLKEIMSKSNMNQQGLNIATYGQAYYKSFLIDIRDMLQTSRPQEFLSERSVLFRPRSDRASYVFASNKFSSTGTRQLNNSGKRLVLPIKLSVPLLCRAIYDFRFTTKYISC